MSGYTDRKRDLRRKLQQVSDHLEQVRNLTFDLIDECDQQIARRDLKILSLEKRLIKAESKQPVVVVQGKNTEEIRRAQTLAILDSMLFAIENYAADGATAPDVTLASQSVLFPTVYDRVMQGDDDYIIERVPHVAYEIVKRGREYVKTIREQCHAALTDTEHWYEHAPTIQDWWINDGLALLYGARSPDWDNDEPLSLSKMLVWRDQPASRALEFPYVWDGMELVKKHGDDIRENSGLPEFNKTIMTTRI